MHDCNPTFIRARNGIIHAMKNNKYTEDNFDIPEGCHEVLKKVEKKLSIIEKKAQKINLKEKINK